jgi:MFS family permease
MTDNGPARFVWLPPGLRPPVLMNWAQERTFLLVGAAAFFAGYSENVFGFAAPQIQASLHIPENQLGLTVSYFRLAAIAAMLLAASADLVGRRRLLLITLFGQGLFTLATAFAPGYASFVWMQGLTRVFGYAEEMLCFVVIAEEMAAAARGWANGALSGLYYTGAGIAALLFGMVTLLPYGWRSLYAIGAVPIFLIAYLRRNLPETKRFAEQAQIGSKIAASLALLRGMVREYPGRIFAMLTVAGCFGFGIGPASVLQSKYLQSEHHYSPGQTTMLMLGAGLIAMVLTVLAGRASDRLGRRPVIAGILALTGFSFLGFYSGIGGWAVSVFWAMAFFAFFSADALIAGLALEIVPTRYRATMGGLRYVVEIMAGAVSLALEGRLYDHFGSHGPAIQTLLCTIPVAIAALLFLPEPAGKTLEEMAA